MFLLALLWLWLFVLEVVQGLTPMQETIVAVVWVLFIFEFLLKLLLATRKWSYIKHNWLTAIALVIPAFRAFRLLRAIRVLRATRAVSTTKIVRALTSTSRFIKDVKEAQGPAPSPEMNVGIHVAHSPVGDKIQLKTFGTQLTMDVKGEISRATGTNWIFHDTDPSALTSDETRRPTDFLDETTLRMAEGPFDLMIVVTDVAVSSRKNTMEPGFVSKTARVIVLSTRKLTTTERGQPPRAFSSKAVQINAAALLLQLLGHIAGLQTKKPGESKVMASFQFDPVRSEIPVFNTGEQKKLKSQAKQLPERELRGGNVLQGFIFHVLMAFRHPLDVLWPLAKNHSLTLALSLPGLATAAVAPSFLLVFTAEIWDVGMNMTNTVAIIYATLSTLTASWYLVRVQGLFLPRKEKRVLTEHLAVANTVIFLSVLLACIGLFFLVGAIMLLIEIYIFPEGLMKTWPTLLDLPVITWADKIRLAAFISAVGVTTGALAGGFESRKVIQHLALFEDGK